MASGARRETTRETFWRRLIRGQARSGRSIRAWCRQHSVQEASFYWWRRKLDRCGATCRETVPRDADRRAPAFIPVRLTEDSPANAESEIEIVLAPERRVRLRGRVDRRALADVLAVLAEESSRGRAGQDGFGASEEPDEMPPSHASDDETLGRRDVTHSGRGETLRNRDRHESSREARPCRGCRVWESSMPGWASASTSAPARRICAKALTPWRR